MTLHLIPYPKRCERKDGYSNMVAAGLTVRCDSADPGVHAAIEELRRLLKYPPAPKDAGTSASTARVHLVLDSAISHAQGYDIDIRPDGITVRAQTDVGLFYALQTLIEMARQNGMLWPCMRITDWPDYERRGFYHDVSRGKVPTLPTLLWLVKQLAALKINEFQLYIENVFAFSQHRDMYADTTPLTPDDIRAVDAACRTFHIDFVPSLTSLGHFDKILRLPRYRHLAEVEPAELRRRGVKTWSEAPWTLCVTDPECKTLISEMYADFLPCFSSKRFNICCDESWDLGQGRSAAQAGADGIGNLYVDWVNFCGNLAAGHGKTVQLWGDIILNHPELIHRLPDNATLLEWGYAADHPFDAHGRLFAQSGRPFYVCPGTSSWQSLGGRWNNAWRNMLNAAQAGLKNGAVGFLNTDWGDHGHQQMPAISLIPMAYGAAVAWNAARGDPISAADAAGLHLFGDRTGRVAPAQCAMANIYESITREPLPNASLEFKLFREEWEQREFLNLAKADSLLTQCNSIVATGAALEQADDSLDQHQQLARDELLLTCGEIAYALKRTMGRLGYLAGEPSWPGGDAHEPIAMLEKLKEQYARLWLQRNKPSRLEDILAIFDLRMAEHRRLGCR